MKRMISAIAVVAIVSSALAFTAKKGGAYCASTTANTNCQIITDKTELASGSGTAYFKYKDWNGTELDCLDNRCPTSTTLYVQP